MAISYSASARLTASLYLSDASSFVLLRTAYATWLKAMLSPCVSRTLCPNQWLRHRLRLRLLRFDRLPHVLRSHRAKLRPFRFRTHLFEVNQFPRLHFASTIGFDVRLNRHHWTHRHVSSPVWLTHLMT